MCIIHSIVYVYSIVCVFTCIYTYMYCTYHSHLYLYVPYSEVINNIGRTLLLGLPRNNVLIHAEKHVCIIDNLLRKVTNNSVSCVGCMFMCVSAHGYMY